ncbi:hypothetical protein DFH07DRAFT_784723 [Mycena maculata]|uniref:Uncharacterized protein n=1 Tax=Mycena maculata TaxID=230809 RepID=A0AAD7MJ38_9AGAR|nr:hypothetical protein DFH07DRAFT_784723 [Mycena maculata]
MSISLTGETECENVCPAIVDENFKFPKTRGILLDTAKAMRRRTCILLFAITLNDIQLAHHRRDPTYYVAFDSLAKVEAWLQPLPEVRLVRDLKGDGHRIWGCVPQSENNNRIFGEAICINSDMAHALESATIQGSFMRCRNKGIQQGIRLGLMGDVLTTPDPDSDSSAKKCTSTEIGTTLPLFPVIFVEDLRRCCCFGEFLLLNKALAVPKPSSTADEDGHEANFHEARRSPVLRPDLIRKGQHWIIMLGNQFTATVGMMVYCQE